MNDEHFMLKVVYLLKRALVAVLLDHLNQLVLSPRSPSAASSTASCSPGRSSTRCTSS